MVSSSYTDALYVPAGSAEKTVTVKNATWSGRNYYGVICVYDDTANAKVTTVLSGVTYHGPQPVYNRYGTTVITATPLMVKTGVTTGPGKIRISWEEAEGVLLSVAKDAVYDKGVYRAALKWYADYE